MVLLASPPREAFVCLENLRGLDLSPHLHLFCPLGLPTC